MSNPDQRPYRAIFILDTRENEETVDEIINRISQTIGSFDGEVEKVENLGIKEFARTPVRGFASAPYIQEKLRLDKTIDRVVITSNN